MPKLKRSSASLRVSRVKRRKQNQRQDPLKRRDEQDQDTVVAGKFDWSQFRILLSLLTGKLYWTQL